MVKTTFLKSLQSGIVKIRVNYFLIVVFERNLFRKILIYARSW
jgi:hypothetical protein